MPISLNQNHPFVNETGTLILAHNGTLDKKVILSLFTNKPSSIDDLSDTQLLFSLLKERYDPEKLVDQNQLFQSWKELLLKIKTEHSKQIINYSMNILFLVKNPSTKSFNLLYCSMYSDQLAENYLKLYSGKDQKMSVLCSSTVVNFLEKDYPDELKKWNLQVIPNGSIGIISQDPNQKMLKDLL